MNAKAAEQFLPCYRAGKKGDSRILKAAHFAETDDGLRDRLANQMNFDEQVVSAIRSIKPPDNLREILNDLCAQATSHSNFRRYAKDPAILCAVAGILLILGFFAYTRLEQLSQFPGRESAERMLSMTRQMSGVELEPTQTTAGKLADRFYMGGFEGYAVPPELSSLPVVGTRLFKQDNCPVAQLAVDKHASVVFVFRASDFGVQLDEQEGWHLFTQEDWVAAVRSVHGICTMIAFRGDTGEMEEYIHSLKP